MGQVRRRWTVSAILWGWFPLALWWLTTTSCGRWGFEVVTPATLDAQSDLGDGATPIDKDAGSNERPQADSRDAANAGDADQTLDAQADGNQSAPRLAVSGFAYQKRIRIPGPKITEDLPDFPLLIYLDGDSDLATHARDANDIRVAQPMAEFVLPTEVQLFDQASGKLAIWVRVPVLSQSDTQLLLLFSHTDPLPPHDGAAAWRGYDEVLHLDEVARGAPNDFVNSAGGPHAQGGGGTSTRLPTRIAGPIGQAQQFDGADDYIALNRGGKLNATGTLSHWQRQDDRNARVAFYESLGTSDLDGFGGAGFPILERHTGSRENEDVCFFWQERSSDSMTPTEEIRWRAQRSSLLHVTVTWDVRSEMVLYLDGEAVARRPLAGSGLGTLQPDFRALGRPYNDVAQRHWRGLIDEFRLTSAQRSPEFVAAEYKNQTEKSGFHELGPLEMR